MADEQDGPEHQASRGRCEPGRNQSTNIIPEPPAERSPWVSSASTAYRETVPRRQVVLAGSFPLQKEDVTASAEWVAKTVLPKSDIAAAK
jgi:hypothetical protein